MGTMTGMDIEAVRQLAKAMESSAGDIDNIVNKLTKQLNGTAWNGPDQKKFHSEWTGTHTNSLKKVVQELKDAAKKANQNAKEQEDASRN